jgi:hypothetical protein
MKADVLKFDLPKIKVRKASGKQTAVHRDRSKYKRHKKHRQQDD